MARLRGLNEAVLKTLEVGDLVAFDRGFFTHWGVYVGMYSDTNILSKYIPSLQKK